MNGPQNATASQLTQVDQNGVPYSCLFQLDVNLTSPPLSTRTAPHAPTGTRPRATS